MRLLETHRVPLITSAWMIFLPLLVRFIETAGDGTVLQGLSNFAGVMWSGFGGASLFVGLALLGWVLFSAWRAGDLTTSKELNG